MSIAAVRRSTWPVASWLALALLVAQRYDSTKTHWAELWLFAVGYIAIPFWAGWCVPTLVRKDAPAAARALTAAAFTVAWWLLLGRG